MGSNFYTSSNNFQLFTIRNTFSFQNQQNL